MWSCVDRHGSADKLEFDIQVITSHRIQDKAALDTGFTWTQARAVSVHSVNPYAVMTISQKYNQGIDVYFDLYESYSSDLGLTWSVPTVIPSLKIHKIDDGYRRSMSDMTPQWHQHSQKILNIGKSFFYTDDSRPDRTRREVAYAVQDPKTRQWGPYEVLSLPEKDQAGLLLTAPGAGCSQWLELEGGDVLIPIAYRKMTSTQLAQTKREDLEVSQNMKNSDLGSSVTVVQCSFDGYKLHYKRHGDELTLKKGRGLGEPSVTSFDDVYFLTIRQDETAFVTRSMDGMTYEPLREWTFDDGSWLGNYNTQQHWVRHSDGLFLVYSRKGANNDHVFRHRAPLFIAQVDPRELVVIKSTERILIPEGGIGLGNFGVTDVNPFESWVTTTEYYRGEKDSVDNEVFVAKINWNKPNLYLSQ